jgi:putative membrane protein
VNLLLRLVVAWAIDIIALWLADRIFDSVRLADREALLIAAAALAIVSAILKPVLVAISFPLIVITLGLFMILVNVAILGITDWLVGGFDIEGFWTYVGAAIVIALVNLVLGWVLPDVGRGGRRRR